MADDAQDELRGEFQRALNNGEEAAEVITWPLPWDAGAPLPHVVSSEHRTVLIYTIAVHDPNWDGKDVRIADPATDTVERLAMATFKRCYQFKFGGPNDEVTHGHPLHGRGLSWYNAHLIHNSMWLMQEEATNSVHDYHDPRRWRQKRHYMLCFHDTVFECLAEDYETELLEASYRTALNEAVARVLR